MNIKKKRIAARLGAVEQEDDLDGLQRFLELLALVQVARKAVYQDDALFGAVDGLGHQLEHLLPIMQQYVTCSSGT